METPHVNSGAGSDLFVGYVPAFRGVSGWRHVFRQDRPAPDGGVIRRVNFDNVEDPHKRLLVDVAEFPTPQLADDYLKAVKADANFAIAVGPVRFGPSSLAYPKDAPRSLYFCRSNLAIWVYSCGREQLLVESWADQIVLDLAQKAPTDARSELTLTEQPDARDGASAVRLHASLRWERGEWAWRKFTATGGTLSRATEGDDVKLWPDSSAKETTVTASAFEPGRETYVGYFRLSSR
jgi:hypothetical protein